MMINDDNDNADSLRAGIVVYGCRICSIAIRNSFDSYRLRRGDDVAIVRDAFDADGAGGALCIVCPEAESALAVGIHHEVGIPVERGALVGAIGRGGTLVDAVVERARMLMSEGRDFLDARFLPDVGYLLQGEDAEAVVVGA